MNRFQEGIRYIGAAWFSLGFLTSFLCVLPFLWITLSRPKWYPWAHAIRRLWGKWLLIWGCIRVKQITESAIDKQQAYVITPNHSSQLDIVTLASKLHLYFNFMAKKELADVPVFGIFFRTIDIAVDRKNPMKAAQAYQKAKYQLKHNQSIVIYPEGTIPEIAPKLSKFKEGAFRLAIEAQVPILPVTIIGNWDILPDKGKFHFMPGKVTQHIHSPIPTSGCTLDDIPKLMEQVRTLLDNTLHSYIKHNEQK